MQNLAFGSLSFNIYYNKHNHSALILGTFREPLGLLIISYIMSQREEMKRERQDAHNKKGKTIADMGFSGLDRSNQLKHSTILKSQ